jgi:tetratricopeptide (TPR) repeat protein
VFRYEGNFGKSEEALGEALEIRNRLARKDPSARHGVAATLHELGVLEVKKHNLDSAATFLQQALDLRRTLELESSVEDMEAECASTLHQLAAVHVAQKPPALDQAEALLKEALGLNIQLYQRAGTLKLKARVAIRRGDFDIAERSLAQALELYIELYGENTPHINVAAVKFQQGTLAFQREQYEQAWLHFSECLRARRYVYSYSQGNHLEVSSVLHKLGCVAFAQKRIPKACKMLEDEKEILDQLSDSRSQRLLQARLTNLTWLRKCFKEMGDEEKVRKIAAERSTIERKENQRASKAAASESNFPSTPSLQRQLLDCRLAARQYAMAKAVSEETSREELKKALTSLSKQIQRSPDCPMQEAAVLFYQMISESLLNSDKRPIFEACDKLRDSLRDQGLQVVDNVRGKK